MVVSLSNMNMTFGLQTVLKYILYIRNKLNDVKHKY